MVRGLRSGWITAVGCLLLPWRGGAGQAAPAEASRPVLTSTALRLQWQPSPEGWRLAQADLLQDSRALPLGRPSGEYTLLYSRECPSAEPLAVDTPQYPQGFPEPQYRGVDALWQEARTPAALNLAGGARHFFPDRMSRGPNGQLIFTRSLDLGELSADWSSDPRWPNDVRVHVTFTARVPGYYSLATPTVGTVPERDLAWAMVPGCFAGSAFNSDLVDALGYGHGLPTRPALARERTASTLMALATTRAGATLAVVAEPGTAADPWASDHDTRQTWQLGLSHLNRRGDIAGTLYHPVLGQAGSQLKAGQTVSFAFRYSARSDGWSGALAHAAYDIYGLKSFLALKQPRQSLTSRLQQLNRYVTSDQTSLWRVHEFGGRMIGAQAYLGGVYGSDLSIDGAMKNSDYGAMWMLASLTQQPKLLNDRLPAARAFKLAQQATAAGFLQGAAAGQYYLPKRHRFTEEFGDYVEPVATTYYICCDLGNILLFNPGDTELRERLRLGADRLLAWQHPDGHWEVAYDPASQAPRFQDLNDFRPTFYGLWVAYRILGDAKYLQGAQRGADWLIEHAVIPARYLGVCGDTRFAADFATGQVAEALFELSEKTGTVRYREAAIAAARFYLTSVYTHPAATQQPKTVKGQPREDWEINQTGLSYEHGGTIGSANSFGPILLASHAGLFVRMSRLTGEPIFRDLARAGALDREAFVDPATGVASYYWNRMNAGAGVFPHHAWWQIGWIMDYLLAEAETRSEGRVVFPHGFFAPKVGPHRAYGFAPGSIDGREVNLRWNDWELSSPAVDGISAEAVDGHRRYLVLLNETDHPVECRVKSTHGTDVSQQVTLRAYGLATLTFAP